MNGSGPEPSAAERQRAYPDLSPEKNGDGEPVNNGVKGNSKHVEELYDIPKGKCWTKFKRQSRGLCGIVFKNIKIVIYDVRQIGRMITRSLFYFSHAQMSLLQFLSLKVKFVIYDEMHD